MDATSNEGVCPNNDQAPNNMAAANGGNERLLNDVLLMIRLTRYP